MPFGFGRAESVTRIAIIPPRHPDARAWWHGLFRKQRSVVSVKSPADCHQYLHDEQTRAYVLLGDHEWHDLIGDRKAMRSALRAKAVYRFGCSAATEARALLQEGLGAFIGYDAPLSAYWGRWIESFLAPAVMAGVEGFRDREPVAHVTDLVRYAWLKVMLELEDRASAADGDTLNFIYAQGALDSLFFLGDADWKIVERPAIVVLDGLFDGQGTSEPQVEPEASLDALLEETTPRDLIARFEIVDITWLLLDWVKDDPARMAQLTPEQFENLVANRLRANNFTVYRNGHTYQRDGGVDLFAVPNAGELPGVVAVQVKHSHRNKRVGPAVIREFAGVVTTTGLNAGLIVTNTDFTPDARWFARQTGSLIRLRNFADLRRWLEDQFGGDDVYDELPSFIQLGEGLKFPVPRPSRAAPQRKK